MGHSTSITMDGMLFFSIESNGLVLREIPSPALAISLLDRKVEVRSEGERDRDKNDREKVGWELKRAGHISQSEMGKAQMADGK